jgi:hypothetical protein
MDNGTIKTSSYMSNTAQDLKLGSRSESLSDLALSFEIGDVIAMQGHTRSKVLIVGHCHKKQSMYVGLALCDFKIYRYTASYVHICYVKIA